MRRYLLIPVLFIAILAGFAEAIRLSPATPVAADAVAVLTQHNNNARTGANLDETALNTANVAPGSFGKLFTRAVDGHIYAQPLYVPGVVIPGSGVRNVVYVATQHNSVYAYDADYVFASDPLWQVSLGRSAPVPADFGDRFGPYNDITVEVGVTSTPVIDLATNTLYVVAFVRDTPLDVACPCTYHHDLHALDLATGAEKFGGPVQIAGSVPGEGADSVDGVVTFASRQQLQRSALLLANGVVYIAFAGYADTDPYHGWLFGYDVATLQLVSIFNTTPNAVATETDLYPGEGGVWMSGQGPSADSAGYIYMVSGNGSFSADTGGVDYGDTFFKLDPSNLDSNLIPQVADWFTPFNQEGLMINDLDVGSTGVLLIPGTTYLLAGGKEGLLYLVDKTNMTQYNGPLGPDLVAQVFSPPSTQPIPWFNSPVFWDRPGARWMYIWGIRDSLKAFAFNGSQFNPAPVANASPSLSQAYPGGALSLSANGFDPATGILWASHPIPSTLPSTSKPGILRAYNAADITQELWNSEAGVSGGDSLGLYAKFVAPTVADGKVFQATFSGELAVYGVLANNATYLPLISGQ